jgi:threonine/homoserine/homoserine lactone efflux protein
VRADTANQARAVLLATEDAEQFWSRYHRRRGKVWAAPRPCPPGSPTCRRDGATRHRLAHHPPVVGDGRPDRAPLRGCATTERAGRYRISRWVHTLTKLLVRAYSPGVHPAAAFGFGLALLPIILTPGFSFTLATQRVVQNGRMSGVRVAIGTGFGVICHATLAAAGLSAFVMGSAEAFAVVRWVGAGYLIVTGVVVLHRSRRSGARPAAVRRLPWTGRSDVSQAFLGTVLNPKAAMVYLTLAPQFLDPALAVWAQLAVLASVHVVIAAGWLLVWSFTVNEARAVLGSPVWRRAIDQVSGLALVLLGLRSATSAPAS